MLKHTTQVINTCVRQFTTVNFGDFRFKIIKKPESVTQLRDLIGAALEIQDPTKVNIISSTSVPDSDPKVPSKKAFDPVKVQSTNNVNTKTEKVVNIEDSIESIPQTIRIELPIKAEVRSMFNTNKVMVLNTPGVTSSADFTYALRKYGPFKHRWDTVKYVLPDDEAQTTQERNGIAVAPKHMLDMINSGGKFLLVVQRSNQWKLICLGAFAAAFHAILALYLYYF